LHIKQQHPLIIRPTRQAYFTRRKVNIKKDLKTKDFPILFKENYKDWFNCIKVKIKEKRAYYSIESNRTEYTWIYKRRRAAGVNREGKPDMEKATTITSTINNNEVDNLISKFEQMEDL